MKEARLILTTQTRNGELIHARVLHHFTQWVADSFGGYTLTMGEGAYRHPNGRVQVEPVMILDILTDRVDLLREIAHTFTFVADQEGTYLRLPDGEVEFVQGVLW